MGEKNRFRAQTDPGNNHRTSCFDTLDEARAWVAENGGGSIQVHDTGIGPVNGSNLERSVFDSSLTVRRTLETWPTVRLEKGGAAVTPLRQTFVDVRADTALSDHDLGRFELVETAGSTLFRAYCQVCGRFVEVTQRGVIYSLPGNAPCQGDT